jgi:hypothetical protein
MGSDDNAECVLGHKHGFESPTGFDPILKREYSVDIAAA